MKVELARFSITRPPQKLSPEEIDLIGFSIYPNSELSGFANGLQRAKCDKKKIKKLIDSLKKSLSQNHSKEYKAIYLLVNFLYEWINYKSKPIKDQDFLEFLESELSNFLSNQISGFGNLELEELYNEVQINIADILLMTIIESKSIEYQGIDLLLFLKTLFVLKKGLLFADDNSSASMKFDIEYINFLIQSEIILPAGLINIRCCKDKVSMEYNPSLDHDCNCDKETRPQQLKKHCICINPYLSDLLVIKEEIARYESGDVAHIENILAGEIKTRKHRHLSRSESYSEEESESSMSEERDHQVSEKFSLQKEVSKTIDTKVNADAGITSDYKYGPKLSITASANISADYSKNKSESLAKSYAKDIIDRSITKIEEKRRRLDTNKLINEIEEKNKHVINNVSEDHKAGIYHWVNKISKAQIYNYGKRTMIDVYVSEPAALYKKLLELNKAKKEEKEMKEKPIKPEIIASNISRSNYTQLLNEYNITTATPPPDEDLSIHFAFGKSLDSDKNSDGIVSSFSQEFQSPRIPENYKAIEARYSIDCHVAHPNSTKKDDEAALSVAYGSIILLEEQYSEQNQNQNDEHWYIQNQTVDLSDAVDLTSVSVSGYASVAMHLSGSIKVNCKLKEDSLNKWQLEIYDLIMEDYKKRLAEFEQKNESEEELFQIKGRNPFINRQIEKEELKRQVIAILLCDYFNGFGSMVDNVKPCGFPEIDFKKLEEDTAFIRFFEQVFEWEYMSYLFYPSMWARKCKWAELLEEDSGDALFDKFLTAGVVRIQISLRKDMERDFFWFLKTGVVWIYAGRPPIFGEINYVSMIQELKESKQGDYSIREGNVEKGTIANTVKLTESHFYWDLGNTQINQFNLTDDIDREIIIDFKTYRIVSVVEDTTDPSHKTWIIELDRAFEGSPNVSFKHSVGAKYWGAPWEITVPTKLVYLRNENDCLPDEYPLKSLC